MNANRSGRSIAVLGAGFAGLSAATVLADSGHQVSIYEKNQSAGGRARKFEAEGFTFDMGPSWYWMPDVIEKYFNCFDSSTEDYFKSIQLDPGFRIYFGQGNQMDIPASLEGIYELFETEEKGAADKLKRLLEESKEKYEVGVNDLVYKPSYSPFEFLSLKLAFNMMRLKALKSFDAYVKSYFKSERLLSLLEFPILFLGGTGKTTPSLYSLMNYACFSLGTWYTKGGFNTIVQAMTRLAEEKGVAFHYNNPITDLDMAQDKILGINGHQKVPVDGVIAGIDYQHFEQKLLPQEYRTYDDNYWDSRTLSPSSLVFYLGLNKKIEGLIHHNLFFDEDFGQHARQIYDQPDWPDKPLFYVCCPSKTDDSVAPEGCENVFLLMPLAPGIRDNEALREEYYQIMVRRIEKIVGVNIESTVIYKRSYCINDFKADYNSYKGNAYGLANTLKQTAFLKPSMRNKRIQNLFYAGQLTVPGPGVPPSIISGQVAAREMLKYLKKHDT